MKQNSVSRSIAAHPQKIWSILTDPQALVNGNTGITMLEGTIAQGHQIKLQNSVAPGQTFKIDVTDVVANSRMVWQSGMPLRLFHGRRVFDVQPTDTGTDFTMTETYTGLLLPLMWRVMPDLAPSFEIFADGLKDMAEKGTQ